MSKTNQKRIIVSVTNDLVADNRVHKVCTTLTKLGFSVLLVGRKLPNSPSIISGKYQMKRFRLLFQRGPFFYAEFNVRLFLFLLFTKCDVYLSNDLDTLPANFFASKIRKSPLVYDSHEYFTEVPELIHRPGVQKIWQFLEKSMVPRIKYAYTVSESIAKNYRKKYGTQFQVVRNVPLKRTFPSTEKNKKYNPEKIILYQGAVNIGRGLEQAILAMKFMENAKLIIAGDGDIKEKLEDLVANEKLQRKVNFTGRLSLKELSGLTPAADLGLSVEEDLGLNYRFALPNKLFDYIQAHVPVLVTNLPEMATIVEQYQIGEICDSLEPEKLAKSLQEALHNEKKRKTWKENLKIAAEELNWEKEEKILIDIYSPLL